jgi:CubicO group peptidase (beta-lactamase class C family)
MRRTTLVLPLLLLLAPGFVLAEEAALGDRVDAVFSEWNRWDSPGAAVAVIRDGEVVYKRGYGSGQLEYGIAITPAMPFHVASVSKQFTSMAIVLLAQDGKLSLDDEVREHVPELHDYGVSITLRHLANHTSGIRDQWELLAMSGVRLDDVITRDHILKVVARQRELNFVPGTEYLYSNSGYTLLAEIVARVSGQSFPDFTTERIFKPLGMSRTHFHDDHEMIVPGRAYSYAPQAEGWHKSVLSYANAGATSLFTTAEDLVLWLDNFRTGRVGGAEGLGALETRGVLGSGDEIDYALGVSHGKYRGTPVLSHGGADAGFRSFVLWAPEHELGVAVVSNLASFDSGGAAQRVVDAVLGDALEALEASDGERPTESVEIDEDVLGEYVGAYRLDIDALVTMQRRGRRLLVELPDGTSSAMTALSETEFRVDENGVEVRFERQPGSPAPAFVAKLGPETFAGTRIDPMATADLDELLGAYWSPELETLYRLVVEDGSLIARHSRKPDVTLTPVAPDEMLGDQWWFGKVVTERGDDGAVTGLRLTGSRVRNVHFERQ